MFLLSIATEFNHKQKCTTMNVCLLFTCVSVVLLQYVTLFTFSTTIHVPVTPDQCLNETCGFEFDPESPLIKCQYVPEEFVECELPPPDLKGNKTAKDENGYGCLKFGGQRYEDVERSHAICRVLDGIECFGDREFFSLKEYPCVKYTGHYFVTTLIYSVLLGILGMDRFCLGHTGTAVGKLLTIGGFGVWWIVDIVLLVLGSLKPADDSNWMSYY